MKLMMFIDKRRKNNELILTGSLAIAEQSVTFLDIKKINYVVFDN